MVARASAQPRTLPAVVEQQAVDLAETQRATGRGATALRDAAGNALVMNPDARYPLLQAQGIDAALAFDGEGTLRAMSPDTQEHRDFAARGITAMGGITAAGDSSVTGHMGVVGQLEADTIGTKTLGVGTVNAARVTTGKVNLDGNGIATPGLGITTDPYGTVYSWKFQGGTFYGVVNPGSSESIKTDIGDIGGPALQAANRLRWKQWRYDPDSEVAQRIDPELEFVGPMVEDMAADPVLEPIVRRDDDGNPVAYDLASLVGLLGKAIAELTTQVADLKRQAEKKPTAKYPWEPGWSPFQS